MLGRELYFYFVKTSFSYKSFFFFIFFLQRKKNFYRFFLAPCPTRVILHSKTCAQKGMVKHLMTIKAECTTGYEPVPSGDFQCVNGKFTDTDFPFVCRSKNKSLKKIHIFFGI